MTQGFDEWFEEEKERYPLKLDSVSCRKGYKAGAASRQAEIDELRKRIDRAEKLMSLFFKEDSYEYAISAHDVLKGESNE